MDHAVHINFSMALYLLTGRAINRGSKYASDALMRHHRATMPSE